MSLTCSYVGCTGQPVRRHMNWRACAKHTPAAVAGHPEPPVPVALPAAPPPPRPTYGWSKDDPLGREDFGDKDRIPRHPCRTCTVKRKAGHKGECD